MTSREPNPESLLALYRELARATRTLHGEIWKLDFELLVKRQDLLDASSEVEQLFDRIARLDSALAPQMGALPGEGGDVDSGQRSPFSAADLELRIRGTTLFMMRREINPNGPALSPGEFLGKLWRVLGKPNLEDFAGFGYLIQDAETDIVFAALFADTGLSYQGRIQDADFLPDVLRRFEERVISVAPIECEYTYRTMSGVWRCGMRDGKPFQERA